MKIVWQLQQQQQQQNQQQHWGPEWERENARELQTPTHTRRSPGSGRSRGWAPVGRLYGARGPPPAAWRWGPWGCLWEGRRNGHDSTLTPRHSQAPQGTLLLWNVLLAPLVGCRLVWLSVCDWVGDCVSSYLLVYFQDSVKVILSPIISQSVLKCSKTVRYPEPPTPPLFPVHTQLTIKAEQHRSYCTPYPSPSPSHWTKRQQDTTTSPYQLAPTCDVLPLRGIEGVLALHDVADHHHLLTVPEWWTAHKPAWWYTWDKETHTNTYPWPLILWTSKRKVWHI